MSTGKTITVATRFQLREWLQANHKTEKSVWLATYKKHHPKHMPWIQAVEELICWGWIDSTARKVDSDRSAHRITPRKPKSVWSAVNKDIVERMRVSGEMTKYGEACITIAKSNGMWVYLDDVERLVVPEDLAEALRPCWSVWEDFPKSVKRGTLYWVKSAKTTSTRDKRIEDVRTRVSQGQRPSIFDK